MKTTGVKAIPKFGLFDSLGHPNVYGLHGLNNQIIEKTWDVTPVTKGRDQLKKTFSFRFFFIDVFPNWLTDWLTDRHGKEEQYSVEQNLRYSFHNAWKLFNWNSVVGCKHFAQLKATAGHVRPEQSNNSWLFCPSYQLLCPDLCRCCVLEQLSIKNFDFLAWWNTSC